MTKFIKAVADETTLSETGKQTAGVADKATAVVKEGANTAMSRIVGESPSAQLADTNEQNKAGNIEQHMSTPISSRGGGLPRRRRRVAPMCIKPLLTEVYNGHGHDRSGGAQRQCASAQRHGQSGCAREAARLPDSAAWHAGGACDDQFCAGEQA